MAYFISFEGGEGGGKSTQVELLFRALDGQDIPVLATREPGGTELGKKIREILVSGKGQGMVPEAELLLYGADRAQHVREVLHPALKDHKVVLSDRFQDSTTVYQGMARGLKPQWIQTLAELTTGGIRPDLTFILDVSPQEGLKRSTERLTQENSLEDRFEKEALAFHEKVREGFLELAQQEPKRFVIIDANRNPMEIHEEILKVVKERLKI